MKNQFFYFKLQSRPLAVKDLWLVIVSLLTKLKHCFQISFTNLMFMFGFQSDTKKGAVKACQKHE